MPSRVKWLYVVISLMVGALALSGCGPRKNPAAAPEPMLNAPKQPFRVLDLCLDSPPWYSPRLFHDAASAIADRIDESVTVGFGGMAVYVSRISSHSSGDDALHFSIPAVAADPAPPQKPQKTDDAYATAEAQRQYQADWAQWQGSLITHHQELAQLQRWVKSQTDRLRALRDPFDAKGSDIYGCLDDASSAFQQTSGPVERRSILAIASTMINNTTVGEGTRLNFSGVKVEVLWQPCASPAFCQTLDDGWRKVFHQFGAQDVSFSGPAVSDLQL